MNEFMVKALDEAKIAYDLGNVPVGAVIVRNNSIVCSSHNVKNTDNVSIYHAEILCIIEACKLIGSWYLDDCDIYVTLKPCQMCEAAIAESRIKNVYYLLDNDYVNNLNSNISNIKYTKIYESVLYSDMLSSFFRGIRNSDVSRET